MRGVGLASKEFASAITKSGIGKASCSVGRALAATTNHGVVITAGYVLNASGTDQRKLPSMFRKWLGTDKAEAAKRKRERRQHVSDLHSYFSYNSTDAWFYAGFGASNICCSKTRSWSTG
jgi:hypothetical protein